MLWIDDSQKRQAKWKKQDTNAAYCKVSFLQNVQEMCICRDWQRVSGCLRLATKSKDSWPMGTRELSEVVEGFWNRFVLMAAQPYKMLKTQCIVHSQWVNFVEYKLHLNKLFLKTKNSI